MFVACGIWCLADVSSVSPSSEQTIKIGGSQWGPLTLSTQIKGGLQEMSCKSNFSFSPFHISVRVVSLPHTYYNSVCLYNYRPPL